MLSKNNFDIPQAISIGTAFAFITSCSYLLGYWHSFEVPIFEYLTVSDILSRSVFPISLMTFAFIGLAISRYQEIATENTNPAPEQRKGFFRRHETTIAIIGFLAFGIIDQFYLKMGGHWNSYSIVASLSALKFMTYLGWTEFLLRNLKIPVMGLLVLIVIPTMTFGLAKSTSYRIINKIEFKEALIEAPTLNSKDLAFLGEAGNSVFFWSYQKEGTLVVRKEEVGSFIIRKHEKWKDTKIQDGLNEK
jgi:hypothetical protein